MIGYHQLFFFPESDSLVAVRGSLGSRPPIVPNNLHPLSPQCCPALLGTLPMGVCVCVCARVVLILIE